MLRALSTRRSRRGYDRLGAEPVSTTALLEAKLNRATSLPAKFFGSSSKKMGGSGPGPNFPASSSVKQAKKASNIHPLFGLFDMRSRRKKTTAKPEFARYMEYVKEAGRWDVNSNKPVIYY